MLDTEGYELRRIPWWYSPITKKQVHIDSYQIAAYYPEMTDTDYYVEMRKRGFSRGEAMIIRGEYERGELQEHTSMFKIDPTKSTVIRRYVRRRYIPEVIMTYTIIEKLKFLRVFLTFSIETETQPQIIGRDGKKASPFYAEVTCETTIEGDLPDVEVEQRIRRVVNGVLKLFFIIFDWNKIVMKGDPDELWRQLRYLQNYAKPTIHEFGYPPTLGMDNFLTNPIIMSRIESADPDEFITRESIIAIGVEYESAEYIEPEYPRVDCYIEKTKTGTFEDRRIIMLTGVTKLWMDKLLEMVISWSE